MAPILALLPSLISLVPEIAKLFGAEGPKTDRNIEIVSKIADIAVAASGKPNLQAAIEAAQTDVNVKAAMQSAVKENWFELAEIGGGFKAAREFSVAAAGMPAWKMPALWVTLALLPLLYGTVYAVLTGSADTFSGELRAAIASSVVTGILGGALGFWLGSSFTTSKSRGLGSEPTNP
jgi:hypothetical protein